VSRPAAMALVSPLLPRFLQSHPEIKLEISADDSHSDIVTGRFDAGIRIGERIAKDMIAVRLLDEFRVRVVAAPSYLAAHPRPECPEDVSQHDCVRLRSDWDGAIQPWVFEKGERRVELTPEGTLILNDMYLVVHTVLDGLGVGYLAEPLVAPFIE